jgi:3a0501s007: preprotein translocase, SecY subunit
MLLTTVRCSQCRLLRTSMHPSSLNCSQ